MKLVMKWNRFYTSIIYLFLSISLIAQPTRIKGRVTEEGTGEGIPFAGVYFKNTTIGISTDMDGYYILETRDENVETLCAMILGYETAEKKVKKHAFNTINFELKLSRASLNAVIVKPDNRYMKRILKQINNNKKFNNPEEREGYNCDVYSKLEMDVPDADQYLPKKVVKKNFGFIYDYMDTSVVSGKSYLPVMITETISRSYRQKNPSISREEIKATRISGVERNYTLSQFAGSMHVKTNFYNNYINIFNVNIPSPIASSGDMFYQYFLIDSLDVEGRKTYKIRFHPEKLISSPVFDGEMSIDAQDFALRDIHVKLQKRSNVNWIRDLVIDVENQRIGDSCWFYKQDKIYADFSVAMSDSSKILSFLGHRTINYSNPVFGPITDGHIRDSKTNVIMGKDVLHNEDSFWDKSRPYSLSEKEKGIYTMVEKVKNVPLYKDIYSLLNTLFTGYYETKYIGFGPYSKLFSYNDLEGARFRLGLRTTKSFSRKMRLTGYLAYGIKDRAFKGGGRFEYIFNTLPTRKLDIDFKHDALQLGQHINPLIDNSIFSSIIINGNKQKLSIADELTIAYDHEWHEGFNNTIAIDLKRIRSNQFVPMKTPGGEILPYVDVAQLRYSARFSWDEIATRGVYVKKYINSNYPIITLDFYGSVKGLTRHTYTYFRPELSIDYKLQLPPIGMSRFKINAGKIFGKVPYPLLKIHEGNGTLFFNPAAFACMDFHEFASDTWVTFFYEHNFKGFFLGKIPLLKRLQLRENFTLKAAYGTISDLNLNNPILQFPENMSSLKKPYVEMGIGISNILRLLRVDCTWRITHRYNEKKELSKNRFIVNVGLELRF